MYSEVMIFFIFQIACFAITGGFSMLEIGMCANSQ